MIFYLGLTSIFTLIVLEAANKKYHLKSLLVRIKGANLFDIRFETKNTLVFFLFILMWVLTAFRGRYIGNDTGGYIARFLFIDTLDSISPSNMSEFGFDILIWIIEIFTNDPHIFLIVTSTIVYALVGIYIIKYSENIAVSVCLLYATFFSHFTNEIRQNISMVLCLFAYQAIKKKKYFIATLIILLASSMHILALLCFLFFFSRWFPKKKEKVLIISGMIIALCYTGVVYDLLRVVLTPSKRFFFYVNQSYNTHGHLAVTFYVIRDIILYFIIYNAYGKEKKKNALCLANFALLLFLDSFGFAMNLFTRVSRYFALIGIVELPNAFKLPEMKKKSNILVLYCVVYMIYFLVVLRFRPNWNHISPYVFWGQ